MVRIESSVPHPPFCYKSPEEPKLQPFVNVLPQNGLSEGGAMSDESTVVEQNIEFGVERFTGGRRGEDSGYMRGHPCRIRKTPSLL